MGSLSVLALVASQAQEEKPQNTMYLASNRNPGGIAAGVQRPIRKRKIQITDSSNKCDWNSTKEKVSESNIGSISVLLPLVVDQAQGECDKLLSTMYSGNHNHGGRGGVQRPIRKRKNVDGLNKSDCNNTTEKVDSQSNIGSMSELALVAEQAQPELQRSQNCDRSFCLLPTTVDSIGHVTKSSRASNSAPSLPLTIVSSNNNSALGSLVAAGGSPTDWAIGNLETARGTAQMRNLLLEPYVSPGTCVALSHFSGFHTSSIQSELQSSPLQSSSKAPVIGGVTSPEAKGPSIEAGRKSLGSESRYPLRRCKRVSTSPTKLSNGFPKSKSSSKAASKNSHQKRRRSRQSRGPPEENEGPSNQKRRTSARRRRRSSNQGGKQLVARRLTKNPMKIPSSFKGVGYFVRTKRWEAQIWNGAEKRQEYLGAFSTEVEAARAYDRATLYFRGVGAQLHFQLEDYAGELSRLVALTKAELLTMLKQQSHGVGSLYPTYPR